MEGKIEIAFVLEVLEEVGDRIFFTRVVGGDGGGSEFGEGWEESGDDGGAEDAVAVGVVEDDFVGGFVEGDVIEGEGTGGDESLPA